MIYSQAFTFSGGYPLGVLLPAGLRLSGLRQLQAFLASSACTVSAGSYHFASIAPLPWHGAFSEFVHVVKLGLALAVRFLGEWLCKFLVHPHRGNYLARYALSKK